MLQDRYRILSIIFYSFSFCVLLRVLLRYSWVGVVMIFLNFRLMYEYDYGLT